MHQIPPNNIEQGLKSIMRAKENITQCEHCGSSNLKFNGLGEYICMECKKSTFSNYGKVRAYLDEKGNASISEICSATGLTQEDVKRLIREDSLSLVGKKAAS